MFLNGSIKIKGPEFEKKEITIENKESGEFYLETEKAGDLALGDFDIWIQMDEDKEIKILTANIQNEELLNNYIEVAMKGKNSEVSLTLSPDQASALSQVLGHYVTAYYEAKALQTERVVKSA